MTEATYVRTGRPEIDSEVRRLIHSMALDNEWGVPRIHGDLVTLGLDVSEATVSRSMPRRPCRIANAKDASASTN